MKLFLLAIALSLPLSASAYVSAPSGDPVLGFRDVETKTVLLADDAGYNDAVSKGHGLFYEDGTGDLTGLYQVSRVYSGTYNTAAASKVTACIAAKDVPTENAGAAFQCVTKGYVDYAVYDATAAIAKGDYLCVSDLASAKGKLVACASSITSPFIALEAKASGSGSDLKVSVQAR